MVQVSKIRSVRSDRQSNLKLNFLCFLFERRVFVASFSSRSSLFLYGYRSVEGVEVVALSHAIGHVVS